MLKLIFLKEIKEMIQSNRFVIIFAVSSILIIMSFVSGAKNYQSAKEQYEAEIKENTAQIAAQTNWFGVRNTISLPPDPLMALVSGISNDIGRNIQVAGRGELTAQNTRYGDEPLLALFRIMDLEFIFVMVLSLFAIIFGYDSINGEKTRGTLRLCFANPLPRASFMLGKLAGSFIGIIGALMIPLLIGALILPVLGVHLSGEQWIKLGLIILSGLAYFGIFLGIAMGLSAVSVRPSSSFLLGLVVWIAAVLILPRASVLTAGRLTEVPNIDEIIAQKTAYRSQLFEEDRPKMASFRSEGNTTDPQALIQEFSAYMGKLGEERNKKIEAFEGRLNEEYQNKKGYQEKVSLLLSRVSPASVFTIAASTLAGTSLELKNRYMNSAMEYQTTYAQFLEEKTGQSNSGGFRMVFRSDNDDNEKPANIDASEMPAFEYTSASIGEAVASALPDIGILFILNVLIFGGAYYAFFKFDVR